MIGVSVLASMVAKVDAGALTMMTNALFAWIV